MRIRTWQGQTKQVGMIWVLIWSGESWNDFVREEYHKKASEGSRAEETWAKCWSRDKAPASPLLCFCGICESHDCHWWRSLSQKPLGRRLLNVNHYDKGQFRGGNVTFKSFSLRNWPSRTMVRQWNKTQRWGVQSHSRTICGKVLASRGPWFLSSQTNRLLIAHPRKRQHCAAQKPIKNSCTRKTYQLLQQKVKWTIPRPPKECFLEVCCYIKPTKKIQKAFLWGSWYMQLCLLDDLPRPTFCPKIPKHRHLHRPPTCQLRNQRIGIDKCPGIRKDWYIQELLCFMSPKKQLGC